MGRDRVFRRCWAGGRAQETGLAVSFGFDLVVGPAAGLEVGVLGGAVVGYGVDWSYWRPQRLRNRRKPDR